MTIYIAGKITGEPDYWQRFNDAESKLQVAFPSASILNPAWLPEGMTPADYMSICFGQAKKETFTELPNNDGDLPF